MDDNELRAAIQHLRIPASQIGSMHPLWDVISDAEAILTGRRSRFSREEIEKMVNEALIKWPM